MARKAKRVKWKSQALKLREFLNRRNKTVAQLRRRLNTLRHRHEINTVLLKMHERGVRNLPEVRKYGELAKFLEEVQLAFLKSQEENYELRKQLVAAKKTESKPNLYSIKEKTSCPA